MKRFTTILNHLYKQQTNHLYKRTFTRQKLIDAYIKTKEKCESKKLPNDVNIHGVFACNELDLNEVKVYGFDYDYTLACYKETLDYLLYQLGRDYLVHKHGYPEEIKIIEYDPKFAIRGLHYDIEKGVLLKIDSFLQIQFGSVYRGLTPVSDEEVIGLYKNKIIPLAYVENHLKSMQGEKKKPKMIQLADLFSVPEMCLLCNLTEFFVQNKMPYHPEILFRDVKAAIGKSHSTMHELVKFKVHAYIDPCKETRELFKRLKAGGKDTFLVTNSPFHFVNVGMNQIIGKDWKDFFDVIIVSARKPRFFTDESRPIRLFEEGTDNRLWDRVTKFEKGKIYCEGTVKQLQEMTGWRGQQVLYFGDHPYSDLADVTLEHGWRTGAIISELTHEIQTLNNVQFKKNCNWLQMLTQLIEENQDFEEAECKEILAQWTKERDKLRHEIKIVFNKQFGSVFRTYHNPTYFSRRLFRFADIYTSSLSNLLHYSIKHTFYPRRGVMPHEYTSYFV